MVQLYLLGPEKKSSPTVNGAKASLVRASSRRSKKASGVIPHRKARVFMGWSGYGAELLAGRGVRTTRTGQWAWATHAELTDPTDMPTNPP